MSKYSNVCVLKGGWSSEREVSLVSGKAIADGLREAGYQVTEVDVGPDIYEVLKELGLKLFLTDFTVHGAKTVVYRDFWKR